MECSITGNYLLCEHQGFHIVKFENKNAKHMKNLTKRPAPRASKSWAANSLLTNFLCIAKSAITGGTLLSAPLYGASPAQFGYTPALIGFILGALFGGLLEWRDRSLGVI
jgi:hypothetical protein